MNVRVVLAFLLAPLAALAADKPNVIFILADDLGAHDLGCFGSTFYETPNIDRLAKRGTRFTQAYAQALQRQPTAVERRAAEKLIAQFGKPAFCRALLNSNALIFLE